MISGEEKAFKVIKTLLCCVLIDIPIVTVFNLLTILASKFLLPLTSIFTAIMFVLTIIGIGETVLPLIILLVILALHISAAVLVKKGKIIVPIISAIYLLFDWRYSLSGFSTKLFSLDSLLSGQLFHEIAYALIMVLFGIYFVLYARQKKQQKADEELEREFLQRLKKKENRTAV